MFVYPYCPMYYYLSGANNPTQLSIVMYGMNTEAQIRDVVRVLEERKVEYVLWDTAMGGRQLQAMVPFL